MATSKNGFEKIAVLEFNIDEGIKVIEVNKSYELALIILRYKNSIIGQIYRGVNNGIVDIPPLEEIIYKFYNPLWSIFIHNEIKKNYLPLVSIIVCTHNRVNDLRNCLDSLKNLLYKNVEIIIVDNAPVNDETKKLVSGYSDYRYICEPKKGLDIARNRGIKESIGEIICFTDDDAIVDGFWINNLVKNFSQPLVAIVTGITMPLELETKAQIIFEQTNGFNRGFIKKEFTLNNISPFAAGIVGAGVNMSIRKEYINDIGLFDEALDGGTYSRSGGDQEFFYRTLTHGFKIIYDPGALVWHRHRRDMINLRETIFGYGVGVFAWWTKVVLQEKEIASVFSLGKWFFSYYFLNLFKSLMRRPGSLPFRLSVAEFLGTFLGPFAYLKAKKF
jgi:GT2 family glycosyltransferase